MTNDTDSSIDELLPEGSILRFRNDDKLPEIPPDRRILFDAKAGIDEPIVRQAIERGDMVTVPVMQGRYGVEELKRMVRTVRQVEQVNENIVIIGNALQAKY